MGLQPDDDHVTAPADHGQRRRRAGRGAGRLDDDVRALLPGGGPDARRRHRPAPAFTVRVAPRVAAVASRPSATSIAISGLAPSAAAAATMNAPMPPVPMTAQDRPGPTRPRRAACIATASGWAMTALVSPRPSGTGRQMDAGRQDQLGQTAVQVQAEGLVAGAQVGPARRAPLARPARDPGPADHPGPRRETGRPGPAAVTVPVNSWPSITGGRASSGPWSHSAESVPQSAALDTRISSSPGPGAAGSGT